MGDGDDDNDNDNMDPIPQGAQAPASSLLSSVNQIAISLASSILVFTSRALTVSFVWGLYVAPSLGVSLQFLPALGLVIVMATVHSPVVTTILASIPPSPGTLRPVLSPKEGEPRFTFEPPPPPPPVWMNHLLEALLINPFTAGLSWALSMVFG